MEGITNRQIAINLEDIHIANNARGGACDALYRTGSCYR
jgi:hypothetical protein